LLNYYNQTASLIHGFYTDAVAAPVREIEMANMEAMDTILEERQSFPMGSAANPKTIEEHHAAMKKIASNIPKCALKCVVSMTPKICGHEYDINSADYSCQCHAKEFSDEAAKCVAKSCHGNLVPMISMLLSSFVIWPKYFTIYSYG